MTQRATHNLDANGQTLGRLATQIAVLLRGKNKVGFTLNQDHGDFVNVKNASKVRLTGKKATQKKYYRHSTHPGGLTEVSYGEMLANHPERIITLAVRGMLPANRLRDDWMKRLTVIASEETNKNDK